MKKLFCLWLILSFCFNVIGCSNNYEEPTGPPLRCINEVRDKYDNILQQIYYNDKTNDYLLKEFTYTLQQNKWVCTNQHTTVIPNKEAPHLNKPNTRVDTTLKIYYNEEISQRAVVILDNDLVTISLVGYYETASWYEFAYELCITNKSDKIITATIDDASIMGIVCPPLFSIDHIEPGYTAFFLAGWDKDTLTRCHIPYIDNVEFMVRIFDNDNWAASAFAGTRILIKR